MAFQRERFGNGFRNSHRIGLTVGFVVPLMLLAVVAVAAQRRGKTHDAVIERGRYLATVTGCNDCHTPWRLNPKYNMPEQDWDHRLSGHPAGAPDPATELKPGDGGAFGPTMTSFRLPFGIVYAANLTPDKETGLGEWTKEMFVKALRKGTHMGGEGRIILPPMPWPAYGQMNDADLLAIFAYLQSLPPIHNEVPENKVPPQVIDAISVATKQRGAEERTLDH
jgi:hypothetical protein